MKLFELINTPVKHRFSKAGPFALKRDLAQDGTESKKSKQLGSGYYASVEQHENLPPGTVVKYGRIHRGKLHNDGYFNYLSQVVKSDRMARNPYLPRIYSVKVLDHTNYAVVMEQLHPLHTAGAAELETIITRMVGSVEGALRILPKDTVEILTTDRKLRSTPTQSGTHDVYAYREIITDVLYELLMGRSMSAVLDPKLKEAIMVIKRITRGSSITADISSDNVMIRRGPNGAQLVITDPIA